MWDSYAEHEKVKNNNVCERIIDEYVIGEQLKFSTENLTL